MPNYVTNRLLFDANHLPVVVASCCPDGAQIDFETLIPSPKHMYAGSLSALDEEDFPCNWLSWSRANWGTKWNASRGSVGTQDDGRAYIEFDTAWSVPYPIICALANRFGFAFEHRYCDEFSNFWGVEKWGSDSAIPRLHRVEVRKNDQQDMHALEIELLRCQR